MKLFISKEIVNVNPLEDNHNPETCEECIVARERGETGGTSTAEYFAIADKHLSDAIALDAQKHPEETIFYTP